MKYFFLITMIYNTYFHEDIKKSLKLKTDFEEQVKYILSYLEDRSPHNHHWYYDNGFVKVDVVKSEYDEYIKFLEELVECSYSYTINSKGITLMVSLTTLDKKLDKLKKEII